MTDKPFDQFNSTDIAEMCKKNVLPFHPDSLSEHTGAAPTCAGLSVGGRASPRSARPPAVIEQSEANRLRSIARLQAAVVRGALTSAEFDAYRMRQCGRRIDANFRNGLLSKCWPESPARQIVRAVAAKLKGLIK